MSRLKLEHLVLGMVSTNCYLAVDTETNAMVIVDPADQPERIAARIGELGAKPEAILLTHGHFDHIGAAQALHEQFQIPICALKEEQEILQSVEKNLSSSFGSGFTVTPNRLLWDGEQVEFAGFLIEVLHTPGHTIGGACYYLPQEQIVFSGDTLFQCSVGRTDFPTGSMSSLHHAIHTKLFVLPDETQVFPGHGEMTEIGYEKQNNPY